MVMMMTQNKIEVNTFKTGRTLRTTSELITCFPLVLSTLRVHLLETLDGDDVEAPIVQISSEQKNDKRWVVHGDRHGSS
jgi:hypothetical protein